MQERIDPSLNTSAAAQPSPGTPSPNTPHTAPRQRRWLRVLIWLLALAVLAVLGAASGLWWWAGRSDSLQTTLTRVAQWLPAEQTLESKGVEGSLRHGGRIDWLRWSSPEFQVEMQGADIAWRLQPLLSRELRFGQIHMERLQLTSTAPTQDDAPPAQPLQSLLLPMRLDVPVRIAELVWTGPPETVVNDLHGHYRYDGSQHQLEVTSLRYAQGQYSGQLQLQGAAPMALQADLQGTVDASLPTAADTPAAPPLRVQAQARIEGTLATEAAQLQLQAQARTANADSDQPLSADVQASLRPWAAQPVEQAQLQLQHMDLALFIPDFARTDLSGELHAGPQGDGWQLRTQLRNAIPGPWDQQALPVRQLSAQVLFDGLQTWRVEQARIDISAQGDGHLQAQGRYDTATQALQGQAELVRVRPADLYSSLDSAPLSGQLQAETDAQQRVQFALDVRGAANGTSALRAATARAQGTWQAPVLQVRALTLNALQAQLQSPSLRIDTERQQVQGALTLQMPGARLQADLDAAPDQGQGDVQLQLTSAEQLTAWLRSLPGQADVLAGTDIAGQGQAQLQWQGGWQRLQQRLQNPAAPRQASGLQLQGNVQAPLLRYQAAGAEPLQVQALQLRFNGSPEQLEIALQTQAQSGAEAMALQTQLSAGLHTAPGAAAIDWQARMQSLQAQWSQQGVQDTTWQMRLSAPFSASQRTTGNPVRSTQIQVDAAQWQLTPPPRAGSATGTLAWQQVLLRQGRNGQWGVRSTGNLQGIPLAWVNAATPSGQAPLLASSGISGDLVVQGRWDIDTLSQPLRADVVLERSSGDLRLSADTEDTSNVTVVRSSGASNIDTNTQQVRSNATLASRGRSARLQNLRLQVQAQGNDLRAQLLWQSERAGNLTADVRSQLSPAPNSGAGWVWPTSAPLSGRVQAQLPNLGIWAFFAPPGWRISGSLDADIAISGTRTAPTWDGHLHADDLSVQSLLDGIDLKNGRMRSRLEGTRLTITELFLRGGEGSSTRILGQSGNLTAAPRDGGTLTGQGYVEYLPQPPAGSSGIRMDLRAQAQQLQVLVRADRQLSISGDLQAALQDGQVRLRGNLQVDRAAIILADASAPKLDSDVHVHSAASRKAEAEKAARLAQQSQSDAGSVQAARPPDVQVQLDLGRDFALQGYGITTRLEGRLQISNGPRITGEIYTINGRYRAWGQSLDVESGTIRFNGPYDNPALEIIAIRPNIEVRAGAKVTGSANNPRVALFSEPDMSDAEKLSWIVMGRSPAAGGAETALLQQAALALLSGGGGTGNFAGNFGLDEIGLKGPSEDGESGAALTVGKRLSQDLYVVYEQSLSGAMGTLYIFYDLSRRLTLRGQTGEQSAIDLIYTTTKD